jgi:hypothetical protein
MSQAHSPSPEQLERRQARQKRKATWDRIWTIVLLSLASVYILWRIVTLISHHV